MDAVTHDVRYWQEPFRPDEAFMRLLHDHGVEVRGQPIDPDIARYRQMDRERRLGVFMARDKETLVGYSLHWTYKSIHGADLLGHDDLWYVRPDYRGRGIGGELKRMGHDWLRQQGVKETSDFVRHVPAEQMKALGFKQRGIWWVRELEESSHVVRSI